MRTGDYKFAFFLPVPDEGGRVLFLGAELPALERALEELGTSVDRSPAEGAAYDLVVAGSPETGSAGSDFFDRLRGLLGEGGYAAVLAQGGFGRVKSLGFAGADAYAAIPGPRNPAVVVPVFDARPLGFMLSHFPDFSSRRPAVARHLARLLVRCGLQRLFLKHFVVILRHGGIGRPEPGMLAAVRGFAVEVLGARSLAVSLLSRVEIETQAMLFFFFEEGRRAPSIVAKAASEHGRNDDLRRERDNLELVRSFLPGPLKDSVPAVRGSSEWRGVFFYLQDFAAGRMLRSSLDAGPLGLGRRRAAADVGRVWDWLIRFQTATASGSQRVGDLGIREMLGRYAVAHGEGGRDRSCLEWISKALARNGGRLTPVCASHGDLFTGNIILGKNCVTVIDWRYFRRAYHTCFDVMTLGSTLGGDSEGVLTEPNRASGFSRERYGTFLAKNGLDEDLFVFLSAATLLEMSARELRERGRSGQKDAAWRRRFLRFFEIKGLISARSGSPGAV